MDDAMRKLAVDTLYESREDDLVMDVAAENVAIAVLGRVADELKKQAEEQDNTQRRLAYNNAAIHCRELVR